jgi:hypothetical protein
MYCILIGNEDKMKLKLQQNSSFFLNVFTIVLLIVTVIILNLVH